MAELSPLHVLLMVMRRRLEEKDFDGAAALARAAAPYLHGRAPVVRVGSDFSGELAGVSDDELKQYRGERRGREGADIDGAEAEAADPDAAG